MQNGGVHSTDNVGSKNKGKGIQFESLFNDEVSVLEIFFSPLLFMSNDDLLPQLEKRKSTLLLFDFQGSASDCYDSTNNVESSSLLDPDSLIYEDDDEYNDQYGYDMEDDDEDAPDEYSLYQDIFDAKDIPTGVEVSMDWFPDKETAEPDGNTATGKKDTTPICLFTNKAVPVAQPAKALPHNSGGVIPNSAFPLPQDSQALASTTVSTWKHSSSSSSSVVQPQTPDTVMVEAPASSGLLLPVPKKLSAVKKYPHLAVPQVDQVIAAPDTSRAKRNVEDFLGSYLFFKRFDIVEDSSDHFYASQGNALKQVCDHI